MFLIANHFHTMQGEIKEFKMCAYALINSFGMYLLLHVHLIALILFMLRGSKMEQPINVIAKLAMNGTQHNINA